ncbi:MULTISPECIES: isochorismatase family protein [Alphaproteobacteria]|uniref:Nicotinamidase-related amidase n=1 Tax=Amphiplicatus metriothermophilus TaxID=1519374 RepID=A0A239Q0L4_9PROT|nr:MULTISPECIES: isochorismatase family protein [Alphaproteobacteria]MBB5520143.1 nicotinamidase-related amidase [Amphiplicatus metriothermophilus]NIJ42280.1 nicotinamidase-related amidase [Parvibaculum indicum]SNT75732.1 Nicotinamidase-related amidase [Amphiplicatus metriothermophilus]
MNRSTESSSSKSFGLLLNPEHCVVVLIDYLADFSAGLPPEEAQRFTEVVGLLLKTAEGLKIPTIVTARSNRARNAKLINTDSHGSWKNAIWRETINPWANDSFRDHIRSCQRNRLILCGMWSDDSITFAALSALEEGFDVYLVVDATRGTSSDIHNTAMARMTQMGTVPISTRQLILEWKGSVE